MSNEPYFVPRCDTCGHHIDPQYGCRCASKLPPGSPAGETASEPDDCEVCRGAKGGVKGNENVVDGKKVCDYCHAAAVPEPVPTEGLGDEAGCADIGYDGFFSRDIVAESAAPIAPAAEDEFITIRKSTLRRLREVIQAEIRTIDDALLTRAGEYRKRAKNA